MSDTPVVAIVGRPNVGKSTLFNRLAGQRLAVVDEAAGTTRDRLISSITWDNTTFILVDTAGLVLEGTDHLGSMMMAQVMVALEEADVILFLTDGAMGLHPGDTDVADLLRRQKTPVVLVVNKCETPAREMASAEFYQLGLEEPVLISALHQQGIGDLMDRVVPLLPPATPQEEEEEQVMRLALVGRPNVGKSSLLNAIVGEERAVVHEEPGTTRDSLDTTATYKGQPLVLIDTAGIRRRGHISRGVEKYSALRAFQAIQRCNVAVLLLDATEMVTAQDSHIAGYVTEAYRGLIIVVNKWDLARERGGGQTQLLRLVQRRFDWAPYALVRFTSATLGEGVTELMDAALEVYQERFKHVGQGELNRLLMDTITQHPVPSKGNRRLRVLKVVHSSTNPPTFTFYVNDPKLLHFSYERFLQNRLRDAFGFRGNVLRLQFRRVAAVRH